MRRALFLVCAVMSGQSLRVFSEFARIDASGEVTAPATPREILSPAIVRNGFTSFQVVVQVPKGTSYWLYIGQNPGDAVKVTMYRESGESLEKVDLPFQGSSTEILWMDLWADRDAPVRRIKVEPELNVGADWVIYPMEVRVMEATVPDGVRSTYADGRELLCGPARRYYNYSDTSGALLATKLHGRNGGQDVAIAQGVSKKDLSRAVGDCESFDWSNPEAYLRIRDYLFRMR
jgi:hypothetical protein